MKVPFGSKNQVSFSFLKELLAVFSRPSTISLASYNASWILFVSFDSLSRSSSSCDKHSNRSSSCNTLSIPHGQTFCVLERPWSASKTPAQVLHTLRKVKIVVEWFQRSCDLAPSVGNLALLLEDQSFVYVAKGVDGNGLEHASFESAWLSRMDSKASETR